MLEAEFDSAVSDDLNTPLALTVFERALAARSSDNKSVEAIKRMAAVLGLPIYDLMRTELRMRPAFSSVEEADIEAALARRKEARAVKDFATSDRLRDELAAAGVEVMDGDPLGWDWKLSTD